MFFSAHWCPPCRAFTPVLKEYYEQYSEAKNFEVIFVSWDRTQDDMQKYFNTMANFLALNFAETDVSVSL